MYRAVLTLLVGLTLLFGLGTPAFAKGDVIWEGTIESKLFSLTGPKKIRITTEGVFINGRFKPAWQLSKDDACLYGLSDFPNTGYVGTSKTWDAALRKFDFVTCQSIRRQARHNFKFKGILSAGAKNLAPVTKEQMQAAYKAATSGDFSKAKSIWERAHQDGNDQATRNLGVMYANGDGVTKDLKKAFEYYSQAAKAGNLEAIFDVVDYLYNGTGTVKDIPEMVRMIEDTYKKHPNNMQANEWMGFIYLEGLGVSKDEKTAQVYLEKAKSLGSEYASKSLAEFKPNISGALAENNASSRNGNFPLIDDINICNMATHVPNRIRIWKQRTSAGFFAKPYVEEAKRRGLTCGVGKSGSTIVASNSDVSTQPKSASRVAQVARAMARFSNSDVCRMATYGGAWHTREAYQEVVHEAKRRGLTCGVDQSNSTQVAVSAHMSDAQVCKRATNLFGPLTGVHYFQWVGGENQLAVKEAKRRGLTCGVGIVIGLNGPSVPATTAKPTVSSAELIAAQKRANELEKRLAALEAKQELQKNEIDTDNQIPLISIVSSSSNGPQGTVSGRVTDNIGVAEVRVDGQPVSTDSNGNFSAKTYVPEGGVNITVEAFDLAGLSSSMSVRLDRAVIPAASFNFARLNPLTRKVTQNPQALALIIGVADYKETNASAVYADSDAKVFADYAVEKLGVPRQRIKTLVNDGADEKDVLLAAKRWLARGSLPGQSDIYVFFAGHGLASDDGEKMYLLPYDGAPELLDKTAILRDEFFADIAAANPRSVNVFLDTCYSGTTRGPDMLIAARPIAIRAKKQAVPDGFTVMTAAAGDQTAKPLEEAKHGMFSYFLMKGMEGDADANQDNQITAGELHAYVQQNVIQQSSGSQTPELQGDAERVLVRFQ